MGHKYTKELLEPVVQKSINYSDVVRNLGLKLAGGTVNHIKSRIEKFNISTDHFSKAPWNKGKQSNFRKKSSDILILLPPNSHRAKSHQLKRALIEEGIGYICLECGINKWNNKKLTLDVDHKDGDWKNNLKENLRFLCPNCHSLTKTYKSKNISNGR